MSLRKLGAIAAVVVAAVGIGSVRDAHADAFAGALIDITNFTLTCTDANCVNGATTGTLDLADFVPGTLSFQDTLTNFTQLNGVPDSTFAISTTFVPSTDAPLACVDNTGGTTCAAIGENNFTIFDAPPPNFTFSRADSLLAGEPISGTGFPTGVDAGTVAETSLNTVASGSSNTTIQLTSSFQFELAHPIDGLNVEFDAAAFLQAFTAAGTTTPTQAGANIAFNIVLQGPDGTFAQFQPGGTSTNFLITSSPCDLNQGATAGPNSPNAPVVDCSGSFQAFLNVALAAGVPYSLTITQTTATQATEGPTVPAPAAALLLGSGLVGLAGIAYVRRPRSA